jgi:HAD superfamily hydrolase (TIGR01509 family)
MDGVLVDSEPMHLRAYQEILTAYRVSYTEEDNREFLGRKDIEILQVLKERHRLSEPAEDLLREKEAILARLLAESTPRPGLTGLLEKARARSLPMAVASSATLPTIELVVDALGIRSYFVTLTSGDEVRQGKPAPDVYLLAAERLRVEPAACLVVEDTAAGITAAKAAGMYCVAIPCKATQHQDHSHADSQLASLGEVDLDLWCGCSQSQRG